MRQLKIIKQITNRETLSLDKYLQEIGKIDLITAEEEVDLARRIHKGDLNARDRLINANLRFVVSVSKQYQHQGLSLTDMINEGNLGLIKAAERFDETRGFKFISYAVWWIRQSILQALAEQSRIVGADVIGTMTDLYLRGSYNVFLAAVELGIPKVIFVSSNHVTDFYEKDGKSTLGREILVSDYPYSTSTYGVLKLAGEGLGYVFSINRNLSVICLRIGTVRLDEKRALQEHPRFRRTLLSKVDVVDLFRASAFPAQ